MKPSPQMFDIASVARRPGAPVWVELHTTDVSHSTAFYRRLFGWKPIGTGGGSRCIFELDGLRVAGWQGAVDGRPSWLTYFGSVDAEATATTAETVGGAIVEPVHEIAGGRVAILADNMGARFGVWQTLTSRGFGRAMRTTPSSGPI